MFYTAHSAVGSNVCALLIDKLDKRFHVGVFITCVML